MNAEDYEKKSETEGEVSNYFKIDDTESKLELLLKIATKKCSMLEKTNKELTTSLLSISSEFVKKLYYTNILYDEKKVQKNLNMITKLLEKIEIVQQNQRLNDSLQISVNEESKKDHYQNLYNETLLKIERLNSNKTKMFAKINNFERYNQKLNDCLRISVNEESKKSHNQNVVYEESLLEVDRLKSETIKIFTKINDLKQKNPKLKYSLQILDHQENEKKHDRNVNEETLLVVDRLISDKTKMLAKINDLEQQNQKLNDSLQISGNVGNEIKLDRNLFEERLLEVDRLKEKMFAKINDLEQQNQKSYDSLQCPHPEANQKSNDVKEKLLMNALIQANNRIFIYKYRIEDKETQIQKNNKIIDKHLDENNLLRHQMIEHKKIFYEKLKIITFHYDEVSKELEKQLNINKNNKNKLNLKKRKNIKNKNINTISSKADGDKQNSKTQYHKISCMQSHNESILRHVRRIQNNQKDGKQT